ncbi:MAG: hypothetical protein KAJ91_01170 [Candidatus Aenigmarchaeota archaeon]|nr:hypothetical protein [Candidatus Aenigmarchaeota archaeon]
MVAILFLLKTFLKENTKLLDAFYVYLEGMFLMHVFFGMALFVPSAAEIMYLFGFISAVIGSAFSTRFFLYSEFPNYEKKLFYSILALGLVMLVYPVAIGEIGTMGLTMTMLYLIAFTGMSSSMYLVYISDREVDHGSKIKGLGGGIGMFLSSGVASTVILFGGLTAHMTLFERTFYIPQFFMVLSPIIILASIVCGRYADSHALQDEMLSNVKFKKK